MTSSSFSATSLQYTMRCTHPYPTPIPQQMQLRRNFEPYVAPTTHNYHKSTFNALYILIYLNPKKFLCFCNAHNTFMGFPGMSILSVMIKIYHWINYKQWTSTLQNINNGACGLAHLTSQPFNCTAVRYVKGVHLQWVYSVHAQWLAIHWCTVSLYVCGVKWKWGVCEGGKWGEGMKKS